MVAASGAPYFLDLAKIGDATIGYITVAAVEEDIPFPIRRVFWTYDTPEQVTRGRHAHRQTETVLVAITGRITVATELAGGERSTWVLDTPRRGLYLPPGCWRTMSYAAHTVQLALASTDFNADDYVQDYDAFRAEPGR